MRECFNNYTMLNHVKCSRWDQPMEWMHSTNEWMDAIHKRNALNQCNEIHPTNGTNAFNPQWNECITQMDECIQCMGRMKPTHRMDAPNTWKGSNQTKGIECTQHMECMQSINGMNASNQWNARIQSMEWMHPTHAMDKCDKGNVCVQPMAWMHPTHRMNPSNP